MKTLLILWVLAGADPFQVTEELNMTVEECIEYAPAKSKALAQKHKSTVLTMCVKKDK